MHIYVKTMLATMVGVFSCILRYPHLLGGMYTTPRGEVTVEYTSTADSFWTGPEFLLNSSPAQLEETLDKVSSRKAIITPVLCYLQ